jgi:hypothetical protein
MWRVDGIGCVMREWRDDVRLGMMRLLSASRVTGRASRSLVLGRVKEACGLREGGMLTYSVPAGYRERAKMGWFRLDPPAAAERVSIVATLEMGSISGGIKVIHGWAAT